MKTAINYIKFQVYPSITFGVFVCIEAIIIYGLYRAIVR